METPNKKRGRPPTQWSESWRKRLVTLRMCGVELKEIVDIIEVLSGGSVTSQNYPERRPQQILRELLSEDYRQRYPTDASTVKARVSLLKHAKTFPLGDAAVVHPIDRASPSGTNPYAEERQLALRKTRPVTTDARNKQSVDAATPNAQFHKLTSTDNPTSRSSPIPARYTWQGLATTGTSSLRLSSMRPTSVLRQLLKSRGRRLSCISEIMSLLSRFTCPRHENVEDNGEIDPELASTLPSHGDGFSCSKAQLDFAVILAAQEQKETAASTALITSCCATQEFCPHARLTYSDTNHLATCATFSHDEVDATDPYGNNMLFFAARTGADVNQLLVLIDEVDDINAVNNDGQTFLFVLNPQDFEPKAASNSHLGRIAALLDKLRVKGYSFGHIDHDGRNFMMMLSLQSRNSVLDWIVVFTSHNRYFWCQFSIIWASHDASGALLLDYLPNSTKKSKLGDRRTNAISCILNRVGRYSMFGHLEPYDLAGYFATDGVLISRLLISPNKYQVGQSTTEWLITEMPSIQELYQPKYVWSQLAWQPNYYGQDGMTPVLRGLLGILKAGVSAKLNRLDTKLINLNARNRESRTIMHLSANYSRPDILDQIIQFKSQKIDVNHRDKHGFSALDYAVNNFNRSRRSTGTAKEMANALQCIFSLVAHGATMTFSPSGMGETVSSETGHSIFIPDTEPFLSSDFV